MKTLKQNSLKHHPLLLAGNWNMTGYFIDEGQKIPVQGQWRVENQDDSRNIQIYIYKLENKSLIFERHCKVFPASPKLFHNWSEQRTAYGNFEGYVNVVEDTLLVQLESEQKIRSVEAFVKVFETEFEWRGTILQADKQLGSWILELLRLS
jgi:hypothetical protein